MNPSLCAKRFKRPADDVVGADHEIISIHHQYWSSRRHRRPTGVCERASNPMNIVRQNVEQLILAKKMNSEYSSMTVLPIEHVYPVHFVSSRKVGARYVLWVGESLLDAKESDSHLQQKDNRSFSPDFVEKNVDLNQAPRIQEMSVASAICTHAAYLHRMLCFLELLGALWNEGKGILHRACHRLRKE